MRVIKIVLLYWTNENVWKKFSKPLLKMIGDRSAFRIALRKLPSSLRAVLLRTQRKKLLQVKVDDQTDFHLINP